MKRFLKLIIIAVVFSCMTFNIRVAYAQNDNVNPDGTIPNNNNNGTIPDGTLPNNNNNGTIPDGTLPNNNNNGTIPDGTLPNYNNNGTIPDETLPNNNNNAKDLTDANGTSDMIENITYGAGGAILGGLITYFAIRDRRTGTV